MQMNDDGSVLLCPVQAGHLRALVGQLGEDVNATMGLSDATAASMADLFDEFVLNAEIAERRADLAARRKARSTG